MTARLLFIHAASPLHAGTGQSTGAIDLAIAREKPTGIPYLPGSSLKGALRDRMESTKQGDVIKLFGPDTNNASEHSGAIFFGDARLLLLPVRSLSGTFAWLTSPYLLQRFARDLAECGAKEQLQKLEPAPNECVIAAKSALKAGDKVIFEDLDFKPSSTSADALAKALGVLLKNLPGLDEDGLLRRLCVVHDDAMSFFLEQGMEVAARIRLDDEAKTVARGALWYEEALPSESVLVSLLLAQPPKRSGLTPEEALKSLSGGLQGLIQLGGKATVGRGLCRLSLGGVA